MGDYSGINRNDDDYHRLPFAEDASRSDPKDENKDGSKTEEFGCGDHQLLTPNGFAASCTAKREKIEADETQTPSCSAVEDLTSRNFKKDLPDSANKTTEFSSRRSNSDESEKSDDDSSESLDAITEHSDERPAWDNKFQYIMAALGFAVGLGNIWRFPYLCQKNGGGAFLIPYFMMLIVEGYPLYFLELAVGQCIRKGAVGVWSSIDGRFVGIGVASIVVSLLIGLYYNMILAWTLFYLFSSLHVKLPWAECPSENGTVIAECAASSPTAYFWYRETLNISDSIENGGAASWKLVLCLLAAWIMVFLGIMKGIKSSGKVMYFATIFPYVILIAFFVRGMTLEGAAAGVQHMFKPDLSRLLDVNVWREAATQIFFSLGLGYGAIIAYSSYNPKHNNCKKDALFVATANSMTSVFACITVFSVIGFKANLATKECMRNNREVINATFSDFPKNLPYEDFLQHVYALNDTYPEEFAEISVSNWNCSLEEELKEIGQGTGLAFIAFAEAILSFPAAPVWSVLFFFMLLCIGMSSEFGILQGFITVVLDSPWKITKFKLTASVCFVMFLLGLIFTMRSGSYFLDIFDSYSATFGLVAVALCETLVVSWKYDLTTFLCDIEDMIRSKPGLYWRISWKYTCPFAMTMVLIASFVKLFMAVPSYTPWNPFVEKPEEIPYPGWAFFLIFVLICVSILCIPIFFALVHFGLFNPRTIGVNPAGRNKRSEKTPDDEPSESAAQLIKNSQV